MVEGHAGLMWEVVVAERRIVMVEVEVQIDQVEVEEWVELVPVVVES